MSVPRLRLALLAVFSLAWGTARAQEPTYKHRWFYVMTNLLVNDNVTHVQDLLRRAHAAGYNGMVITDSKFDYLDHVSPEYFDHARQVKQTARELGMDIYPLVATIGYEGGPEIQDPQLAEGFPARDVAFKVANGEAQIVSDPALAFPNGGFEDAQGDTLKGWNYQDAPGKTTFVDHDVKHSGGSSLRMENIGDTNSRVIRTVQVAPFHQYHLSVWIKTQDFATPSNARGLALGASGKTLAYIRWDIQRTQDWTHYDAAFNSLDNTQINLYYGVWGDKGGKIWWDDAQFEDAGLSNLLRRPGCPFAVKGEDGTVYQEGRDYLPVSDPKTGNSPWMGNYDAYHAPPAIRLAPNSRIQDGQTLRVSYYHALIIDQGSVAACLSEPKLYDVLRDQITRVNALWEPKGLFLSQDEIREVNWCEACQKRGLTPGQLLADNMRRCIEMVRAINPQAEIYAWSDMFDPFHNAVDDYYLVNGSLKNSWEGVDKGVSIVNWNFDKRDQSLPFFANRGHHQVLAGYYDASPEQIRVWVASAKKVKDVDGVMYTTWANNYTDLEAFARNAWGG